MPSIGDAFAEAVILYREEHGPFEKMEDLRKIPNIDDARAEAIALKFDVGEDNEEDNEEE